MKRSIYSTKAKGTASYGKKIALCSITLMMTLACNLSLSAQNELRIGKRGTEKISLADSVSSIDLKGRKNFSDYPLHVEPLGTNLDKDAANTLTFSPNPLHQDVFLNGKLMVFQSKTPLLSLYSLNFGLNATSSFQPDLLARKSALLDAAFVKNRFRAQAAFIVNQYRPFNENIENQFGIAGSLEYLICSNLTAGISGSYYTTHPFYSIAAMPYVGTNYYGAWIKYENDKVGIRLGAERYYDAFSQKWNTVPIVSPIIRLGKHARMEIPLGEMLKSVIDHASDRRLQPIPQPR